MQIGEMHDSNVTREGRGSGILREEETALTWGSDI